MTTGPRQPTSLRQIIAAQQVEIQQLRSALLLLTAATTDRATAENIARQIKDSGFSNLSLDDIRDLLGSDGQTLPPKCQGEKNDSLLEDWVNAQLELPGPSNDPAMFQDAMSTGLTPAPSLESTRSDQSSPQDMSVSDEVFFP